MHFGLFAPIRILTRILDSVKTARPPKPAAQTMLISYAQLASTLITGVTGVCSLDGTLGLLGKSGQVDESLIARGISAGGGRPRARGHPSI